MSLALPSSVDILRDRGACLARARQFFSERDILEVDTPMLSRAAAIDPHIELVKAECLSKPMFLMSSPEYGMKRLLAQGCGDCYQLSHVFRDGECGERHVPEFMMAEWYRVGITFEAMIEETAAFLGLFIDASLVETLSYEEMLPTDADEIAQDEVFAQLGREGITAVVDFPAHSAALAEIEGHVAKRFELFYQGMELANGYRELRDAQELRRRFDASNAQRVTPLPLDEALLTALPQMPACCGVAVGFERLMMLRHGASHINEVVPLPW